nr:MAG TPA: hypothetical protein [Caudoviricetes sp.]
MDAVKFLQERSRMYKSGAVTPGYDYDPVIAVKVVEEWSAAHPRKTRQSVFLEQWPNARPADDGVLTFCPKRFDFHISCLAECHSLKKCSDCRREFWMQEVER